MKISILVPPMPASEEEINLIKFLCQFEGIAYEEISDVNDWEFKKYYKGHPIPQIIIHPESDKLIVLSGFYTFVEYIRANGLTRC
jgi:hypothetical protein